ncbi:hypothetical protein HDU88_003494 [Geranomyces variabilis]|nr:hypothetical protein HDU88_003494 [Geranomyces variabilis]
MRSSIGDLSDRADPCFFRREEADNGQKLDIVGLIKDLKLPRQHLTTPISFVPFISVKTKPEDPQCKELYDFIENGDLAKLQTTLRKNASTRDTAAIISIDNVLTMYHVKAAAKVSAEIDHPLGNAKSQVRGTAELSEIDESDTASDDSKGEAVAMRSRISPVVPNNAGQSVVRPSITPPRVMGGRALPGPAPTPAHAWLLSTGTDVSAVVNQSRLAVAEEDQPLSLLFLGIIDFDRRDPLLDITEAEWEEMRRDFYKNIKLTRIDDGLQQTVAEVVEQIDTVIQQADVGRAIDEIEKLSYRSPRVSSIPRRIQQYAANVMRLGTRDLISEHAFDNATNGHLVKILEDPEEDHWRLEQGELQGIGSKPARNHHAAAADAVLVGQKLGLRLTLKDTDAQLEALIYLRSGSLPKATKSKIAGDRADLMNCLMETLWSYMGKVQGVPSEMLVDQFILGLQSYDWESHLYAMRWRTQGVFCCGSLKRYTLPRTLADTALIEDAVFTLLCVDRTLSDLVVTLRKHIQNQGSPFRPAAAC